MLESFRLHRLREHNQLGGQKGIDEWTKALSNALSLEEHPQDWGVCNADPDRIEEFIRYFEQSAVIHPWQPEALAELILASADDALSGKGLGAADASLLMRFVRDHRSEFPIEWEHWINLDPTDSPVTEFLRKAAQ